MHVRFPFKIRFELPLDEMSFVRREVIFTSFSKPKCQHFVGSICEFENTINRFQSIWERGGGVVSWYPVLRL